MKHASQTPDCIGAAGESKQANLVAFAIVLHEEAIRILDVNA